MMQPRTALNHCRAGRHSRVLSEEGRADWWQQRPIVLLGSLASSQEHNNPIVSDLGSRARPVLHVPRPGQAARRTGRSRADQSSRSQWMEEGEGEKPPSREAEKAKDEETSTAPLPEKASRAVALKQQPHT